MDTHTDDTQHVERAVLEEVTNSNDPGERRRYALMLEMARSMRAHTDALSKLVNQTALITKRQEEHDVKLDDHIAMEEANQARWQGLFKGITWIGGGVAIVGAGLVGLCVYIWSGSVELLKQESVLNKAQQERIGEIGTRQQELMRRLDKLEMMKP